MNIDQTINIIFRGVNKVQRDTPQYMPGVVVQSMRFSDRGIRILCKCLHMVTIKYCDGNAREAFALIVFDRDRLIAPVSVYTDFNMWVYTHRLYPPFCDFMRDETRMKNLLFHHSSRESIIESCNTYLDSIDKNI